MAWSAWNTEKQFYDQRGKYMIDRVNEAYEGRRLDKGVGTATAEKSARDEFTTLRDDAVKRGKAVSLLAQAVGSVTDSDLDMIEAQAKQDSIYTPSNSALNAARSVLGRAAGTSPTPVTEYTQSFDYELGKTVETPFTNYNYSLTQAEKDKLKSQDRRTLLDKFFGVNTTKY